MRFLIILFLLFQSNFLNAFELNGEITQGALIIGREQTDKSIYVNKQKIKLSYVHFIVSISLLSVKTIKMYVFSVYRLFTVSNNKPGKRIRIE